MNGTETTDIDLFNDISCVEPALTERSRRFAAGLMHPEDVVGDLRLTQAEKREILASWASDVRAVPDAPVLRQLDNGAVVRVDDVLRALKSLDDGEDPAGATFASFRTFAGLRTRFPARLRSVLRRNPSDDDDDPPPCPAAIIRPLRGPLSGGGTVDVGLALAG